MFRDNDLGRNLCGELTIGYESYGMVSPDMVLGSMFSSVEYAKSAGMFDRYFNIRECSFCVLLRSDLSAIGHVRLSEGTLGGTIIDMALVARAALLSNAKSVILYHNHPSGSCVASKADITCTVSVAKALELFEIKLLDHIIIGNSYDNYLSMKSECLF